MMYLTYEDDYTLGYTKLADRDLINFYQDSLYTASLTNKTRAVHHAVRIPSSNILLYTDSLCYLMLES